MILSPDGHCRPFDAGASGTVAGNGAGVVVLKRLADALADGDPVHAVILGTAVNNDGADKVGFTAPSVDGQAAVIAEAQDLAGVGARDDRLSSRRTAPAPRWAIRSRSPRSRRAFRRAGARGCGWCALGSVKSNIGHLDTAAGVAGLIKAVLAVRAPHDSAHAALQRAPIPSCSWRRARFASRLERRPWRSDGPRRAGVSSFGIGGTNAHVVVEEAEPRAVSGMSRRWLVLPMSAQTPTALHTLTEEIADVLTVDAVPIADVAYTLAVGRKALGVRSAVVRDAQAGARSASPGPADDGSRAEADDLARRWTAGEAIDWREHYAGESRHRVVLPTYPFERKPYWIDRPAPAPAAASRDHVRSSTRLDDWLYAPTWRRGGALATSTAAGRWLILADTTGVGEGLAGRLRSAGAHVEILAREGALAPDRSRYRALIDRARADNIVHLWTVGHAASADRFAGFASVLALGQALAERGSRTNVTVVTSAGHAVTGDESLRPEHALLLGPVRVLPQEHPELRYRAIDIPEGPLTDKQQDLLFAECLQEEGPGLVAHRGPFRWFPGFDRCRAERPERPPPAAVYLITGGLGEMGLALARHLYDTTGARLVLTSRTPLPPPQTWQALVDSADVPVTLDLDDFDAPGSVDPATARRLRALVDLQAQGADVLILAADAADEPQMRAAFDRAEARFGRVDVVVHAAGLPAAQAFAPVEELDAAAARRHFTPKVDGVEVLRTIVRERDVGACVLMSSLAGTLGGLGFAAYAAASAYLDAVAQQEDGRAGTRWLSIAWDAWRFDAGDDAMRAGIARNLASTAIRPLEGAALFAHIIASGHAGHVLVSTTDLERRASAWTETRPAPTALEPGPLTRVSRSDIEHVVAEILAGAARCRTSRPAGRLLRPRRRFAPGHAGRVAPAGPLRHRAPGARPVRRNHGGRSRRAHSSRARASRTAGVGRAAAMTPPGAAAIVARLRALGIELQVEGDRLLVHGARRLLTRELQDDLRKHKPELLSYLRTPAQRTESPLSSAQRRLWFLDQMLPGQTAYTLGLVQRVDGPLDVHALRQALTLLVERHEILRMRVALVDGAPVQRILAPGEFDLRVIHLPAGDGEQRAVDVNRAVAEELARPFDLAGDRLLRAVLVSLGAESHVLVLTAHHLIADGWSVAIIGRDLAALYDAAREGRPASLPPVTMQYADYVESQRAWLESDRLRTHLDFWTRALDGIPRVLALPTDRPRPALPSLRGARLEFTVDSETTTALRRVARASGATLFMTLLAGMAVVLGRYCRQQSLMIGTPIAGRHREETASIVGCLVNTLALGVNLEGDPAFSDLVARVRETTLGAYDHQELPFERLVEQLHPERDLSRNPLVQVSLGLHNAPGQTPLASMPLPGLHVAPLDIDPGTVRFDLECDLWEVDGGLHGRVLYATDLFDDETIARLVSSFTTLVGRASRHPQTRISSLPLMPVGVRDRLVVEWNPPLASRPADLLHELVAQQAHRTPDATALVCGAEAFTYRGLCERAGELAGRLRRDGVGPDTPVGIHLDRGAGAVIAMLAILEAGGAFVPLDPEHPQPRTDLVRRDARIALVVDEAYLQRAAPAGGPPGDSAAVVPDNLAYVMYTSGSTGQPKGVDISHAAVVSLLHAINGSIGLNPDDVWLAVTTFGFDISVLEVFLPLINGSTLVVATRDEMVDSDRLMAALDRHGVTAMQATPATWWMLVESGWAGRPALKALCGGEALPPRLAAALAPRCGRLWNVYGPTETTIWSSLDEVTVPERLSIGWPIANSSIHVLDDQLEPLPIGVEGEIWIAGDGMARGYRGRPDQTADRFLPCPFDHQPGARMYRTGDLGRRRSDGRIECLGRIDQQVKVRGFRIEPAEIEAALMRDPGVAAAAVALRGTEPGDQQLVAYVRPSTRQGISVDQLRARLQDTLPAYMMPSAIVSLEALPLTPSGKLDRAALPAPSRSAATATDWLPPASEVEHTLATIWGEVLKAGRIGVRDNFFDLGGHSLLMVAVRAQIAARLGADVAIVDLFRYPTIRALAGHLNGHDGNGQITAVPDRAARQLAALGELAQAVSEGRRLRG